MVAHAKAVAHIVEELGNEIERRQRMIQMILGDVEGKIRADASLIGEYDNLVRRAEYTGRTDELERIGPIVDRLKSMLEGLQTAHMIKAGGWEEYESPQAMEHWTMKNNETHRPVYSVPARLLEDHITQLYHQSQNLMSISESLSAITDEKLRMIEFWKNQTEEQNARCKRERPDD